MSSKKQGTLENPETLKDVSNDPDAKPRGFSCTSFLKWIFFGYVVGLLITILCFLYFTTAFPSLKGKSNLLVLLLVYICILLFSKNVRCLSVLVLPILFSSKGRSVFIATALILAATGPTVNILRNVDILIESISCGQEQLKGALEKMLDVIKRPLVAVKNAVRLAMAEMKKVLKRAEEVLVRLRLHIVDIINAIKKAFDWLGNVVSMCNKTLGTPFDRCIKLADKAMRDCKEQMGALSGLCNVTDVFRGLCYSVKFVDAICVLVEFISFSVVATVNEKLEKFTRDVKTMFYVSVKFDHEFTFKTVATKNFTAVSGDIYTEIQKRMSGFFYIFGWVEIVGSFTILLVVVKAVLYKRQYLNSDRFDNNFITKDFVDINTQREKMGKEVVLPLTRKERGRYVKITACTIVRAEMYKMSRTILYLTIPSAQLLCICLTDYSLYWLLSTILFYGRQEAGLDIPPFLTVNVSGGGLTADIFKGIVHAFEPLKEGYEVDPRPCLPVPRTPNFTRYWEIALLVSIAWVFLFLQPYGLRFRQVIMGSFYPYRSKQRALWLYSEILLKRANFIKFARRQARNRLLKDGSAEAYSFLDWIRAKTSRVWILRKLLGQRLVESCNICGTPLHDDKNRIECQQMGCKGMYCADCFTELNNMCCLCNKPIDYGDLSDVSEEKDSSDDAEEPRVTEDDEFCARYP